jgi:hypothetical protein
MCAQNRLIPSPRQPITAASATMASGDVADSTTAVDSRSPDRLATSSIRQMTQKYPSLSRVDGAGASIGRWIQIHKTTRSQPDLFGKHPPLV